MTEPIAWINGSLQPFAQTAVPVWDLGLVAGAAVTEMARTYNHQPFRLERHVQRLLTSLTDLGFPQPWTADFLIDAALEITKHNAGLISSGQDLGIVLFSTAGSNATYLSGISDQTTTVVHTFVLPFAMWKSSQKDGVRLRIPEVRQIPADCFSVAHKVRNRLHWWLADQQAAKMEQGSKALLLDHDGFVTETSTSCFYIVREGRIITSNRSVLTSLSSEIVEELARFLRIPFERREIPESELLLAEEAFLSSTPAGLLPVSHINGQPLPIHQSDSVYSRLMNAWRLLTGVDLTQQIQSH